MLERRHGSSRSYSMHDSYDFRGHSFFGMSSPGHHIEGIQTIPVNIFEMPDGIEVVAPMPGLEPENIEVNIVGNRLTIHGEMRGLGQERKSYLLREWSYGPYLRTIELPFAVDVDEARVTFGNGVLTMTLPRAAHVRPKTIRLKDTAFTGRFGSSHQDEGEPHAVGADGGHETRGKRTTRR